VSVGVGVGVAVEMPLGVGVGTPGRPPTGVGVAVGTPVGPAFGLGVGVANTPEPGPCDGVGVLEAEGDWLPEPPPTGPAPEDVWPRPVPLALAPSGSQSSGAGSQLRPAPTKGSQFSREPVSQISVPGPRPSTKKPSRNARRRARRADVTRSRRVLQNLLPVTAPSRIVSVATSISLRNDGDLKAILCGDPELTELSCAAPP